MDGVWDKLGYRKIGVIYPEDAFGTAVLGGVTEALKAHSAEPVKVASYERQTANVAARLTPCARRSASRGGGRSSEHRAPILKQSHAKRLKPLFLTVSFVAR